MAIVLPPQARYNMSSVKAKVRNEQADTSQVYWGANLHTDFSFGSSLLPFLVGRARHHRHNGVGLISFYAFITASFAVQSYLIPAVCGAVVARDAHRWPQRPRQQ